MGKLYDIYKASKLEVAPDYYTALIGRSILKSSAHEYELTDTPPLPFDSIGRAINNWTLWGNAEQNGIPNPQNIIDFAGVGALDDGQYKISITCGGTTTPIYLGEVQSTRKIKKLVFDGTEEGWERSATRAGCFALRGLGTGVTEKAMYCTHATYVSTASQLTSNNTCYMGSDFNLWLDLFDEQTNSDQFKEYLAQQYAAGTPITIWYVVPTPQTAVVNEPLMKIGNYADSISNAASIPTAKGSNTLTVGTDIQPSQMYIKYYK